MILGRWHAALACVCLIGVVTPLSADAVRVRVNADRVNLRAADAERAEVVGQVSTGQELNALSELNAEWVRVEPPQSVDLWIYADLIDQGVVSVNRAQVRSGAGLNYHVVGRLERGDRVTERGRLGDWMRIAPPPGSALWISAQYVSPIVRPLPPEPPPAPERRAASPPREPAPQPSPQPSPAPAPAPLPEPSFPRAGLPEPSAPAAPKPERLARFDLAQDLRQGERGRFKGLLSRSGFVFRRPSRYRIVSHDRMGRAITLCYVIEQEAQLEQLVGETVEIDGRVFWISGVAHPAVAVDRLRRAE